MIRLSQVQKMFIIVLITIFGLLLRFSDIFRGDFTYFLDLSRDLLLTKDIIFQNHITLIGARAGIQGTFHGPLWLYFLVPFWIAAQGDPFWTLMPPFIIIHALTIFTAYIVGKKLYSESIGLLWSFFVAISSLIVTTARFTTNAQIMPLLVIVYIYAFITVLRGQAKYLLLLWFLTGLGHQFQSALAVFLMGASFVATIPFIKKNNFTFLILNSVAFIMPIANFVIFEIKHSFLMSSAVLSLIIGPHKTMSGYTQFDSVIFRVGDRISKLLESFISPIFSYDIFSICSVVLIYILFVYCVFRFFHKKKNISQEVKELFVFLVLVVAHFVVFIAYPYPLFDHYILAIIIFSSLILSLAIRTIWDSKNRNIRAVLIFSMLVIVLSPVRWFLNIYKTFPATKDVAGSYRMQKRVAQYAVFKIKQYGAGYFVYDPGQLTYNMDYLAWYEGKRIGVVPQNEKKQYVVLILAKHPVWDKNAYGYFKKDILHTNGKTIERKYFSDVGTRVEVVKTNPDEPSINTDYFPGLLYR